MRLGRPQKLIACVLAALCLANGNVLAQQAGGEISLPVGAIAGKSREGEARASEAKRPAPAAILLKSLVAEALEQNPEIIKQTSSKQGENMNNIITKTTRITVVAALLILVVAAFNYPAPAQDHSVHHPGQEMKAPQTAQEHRERAEYYKKKTVEDRAEAESQKKKMLVDYSKGVARNPKDTGENPYIKKMRLHCEKYISAAENLAREADEMGKFHEMRAKEMEGK